MAKKVNREIDFVVKMTNKFSAEMGHFKQDIEMMKKGVQDFNTALGQVSDAKLKKTKDTMISFMKEMNRVGTKTQYFKGFQDVAKSFGQIASFSKQAGEGISAFAKASATIMATGEHLQKFDKNVKSASGAFSRIASAMKQMGESGSVNKFKTIGDMFQKMANVNTTSGLVPALTQIRTMKDDIIAISNAITSMTVALGSTSAQAGSARMVGGVMGSAGWGPRGGTTGGAGSGPDYGRIVTNMSIMGWDPRKKGSGAEKIYKSLEGAIKDTSAGGEFGPKEAVSRIRESIQGSNLRIQKYLEEWAKHPDKWVRKFAADIQKSKMGTAGIVTGSMEGSLFSGKKWGEGAKGIQTGIAMAGGTAFHEFSEQFVKKIGATGGLGKFIAGKGYETGGHKSRMIQEAEKAEGQFTKMATRLLSKEQVADPKILQSIGRAAANLRRDIEKSFVGPGSIFGRIDSMVLELARKQGGSVEKKYKHMLRSMGVEVEKTLAPLQIAEPGAVDAKTGAVQVSRKLPQILQKDAQKYMDERIRKVREAVGEESVEFKAFMADINRYGMVLAGKADLVLEIAGNIANIDYKTGMADPRYARGQAMPYSLQLGREKMIPMGWGKGGVGSFTYSTRKSSLSETGFGVSETDIRSKELASGKQILEDQKQYVAEKQKERETNERILAQDKEIAELQNRELNSERQINSLIKQKDAFKKGIITASGRGGAGGVPPAGTPPSGGGGGTPFTSLVWDRTLKGRGAISDSVVALSQYDQALTQTYLKQQMLGQSVNLTKVKMTQYDKMINDLSATMSNYVSAESSADNAQTKKAAHTENLIKQLTLYDNKLKEAIALDSRFAELQRRAGGITKFEGKVQEGYREKLAGGGVLTEDEIQRTKELSKSVSGVEKERAMELQRVAREMNKTKGESQRLRGEHDKFVKTLSRVVRGEEKVSDKTDKLTSDLKESVDVVVREDKELRRLADGANNVSKTMQVLSQAVAHNRKEFLDLETNQRKISELTRELRLRFKAVGVDADKWGQGIVRLNSGMRVLSDNINKLKSTEAGLNAIMDQHLDKIAKLEMQGKKGTTQYRNEEQALKSVGRRLQIVAQERRKYEQDLSKLQMKERRELDRTAEAFRGTIRTQLRGFKDMMKSQAAWVLGYGVMFGAIRGFKEALGSVIEVEHQMARAMRTARSEFETTAGVLKRYETEGVTAMIKFGEGADYVGEVLYQLGSAGLTAEENLAALNSTMNMLVATEGDVTDSTKMVAAVYNNFKNSIEGVTSLQMKFKYINDIVVATFRDHQVELNELREGYKYLMAMGKESNLTFLQMSALLGTLNDHLIKSGIAGRSMQTVLSRIAKQPVQFSEAFGIKVNLKGPLDLIDILDKLNKKYKQGSLTVEEVGTIFERMGMRGAKTFITLIRNVDELHNNIYKLKYEAEDAAEVMARVMLEKPDVAFKQLQQSLEALIRLGFEPLVKMMAQVAVFSGQIGRSFSETSSFTREFMSSVVQILAVFAQFVVASKLLLFFSNKFKKGGEDYRTVSELLKGITKRFKTFGKAVKHIGLGVLSAKLVWIKRGLVALTAAIPGGVAGLIALAAASAGIIGYKLYKYFNKTSAEISSNTMKLIENIKQGQDEVIQISKKINRYKEIQKVMKENAMTHSELVSKYPELISYRNLEGEAILKTNEQLGEQIRLLKEEKLMKKEQFMIGFKDSMKEIRKDINWFYKNVFSQISDVNVEGLSKNLRQRLPLSEKDLKEALKVQRNEAFKELTKTNRELMKVYTELNVKLNQTTRYMLESETQEEKRFWEVRIGELKYNIKRIKHLNKTIIGEFTRYNKSLKGVFTASKKEIVKPDEGWLLSESPLGSLEVLQERSEDEGKNRILQLRRELKDVRLNLEQAIRLQYGTSDKWVIDYAKNMSALLILSNREESAKVKIGIEGEKIVKLTKEEQSLLRQIAKEEQNRANKAKRDIRSQISNIETLRRAYDGIIDSLKKAKLDVIKGIAGGVGPFEKLLQFDDRAAFQRKQLMDKQVAFFEDLKRRKPGDVKSFFTGEKTTVESARKEWEKQVKELEKYHELQKKIVSKEAWHKYNKTSAELVETHSNKVYDLTYKMKEYHTIEEQMDRLRETHSRQIRKLRRSLEEYEWQEGRILALLSEKGLLNSEQEFYYEKMLMQTRTRISNLKEEIDITILYNNELERRAELTKEITRLGKARTTWGEYAKSQMGARNYSEGLGGRLESEAFRQQQAIVKATKLWEGRIAGESDEGRRSGLKSQMDTIIENMEENHQRRKFDIKLKWQEDWLTMEEAALRRDAEFKLQQFTNLTTHFSGIADAMKAATFQLVGEQKTYAETITGTTYEAINMVGEAIFKKTNDWLLGNRDAAMDWKDVIESVLTDILSAMQKYVMQLIVVAFWQQVIGMVGSAIGGGAGSGPEPSGAMAGSPTGGSAPVSGASVQLGNMPSGISMQYQYGGLLVGGIPNKDSVPIMGMPGEYMIPKDSVDFYGRELFDRLRSQSIRKMQTGGLVSTDSSSNGSSGGSTGIKNVQVNVINNTGENLEAADVIPKIDFQSMIIDVVVSKQQTSKQFRDTMNAR